MLKLNRVALIVLRELRDQMRDRRTMFMVVVLPMLLYPALGLGMMQLTLLFREQPRTVVLLGADHLPEAPALFSGDRFAAEWFREGSDPGRLHVISDRSDDDRADEASENAEPWRTKLLSAARAVRAKMESDGTEEAGRAFDAGELEAVLLIPEGFRETLARVQQQLERGAGTVESDWPRPRLIYNKASDKSAVTWGRTTGVLERWEEAILADLLQRGRLDASFTHPALADPVDVSLPAQISASLWGRMFPTFLVLMAVTGAFYPAIDLVAGEKERGTMETLLICPATRMEIVLGKFFTVMLFSMATAMLNLTSMGFTGRQLLSMVPSGSSGAGGSVELPPVGTLLWLGIILVPLSALFSALALALATFARSSKEGQYYLTPLLMGTMGLTVFCLSPGTELTPQLSVLPVVGPALLLKGILLSSLSAGAMGGYVPAVLLSSCIYSGLALWWAVELFHREEVLFREGERFELRLWLRNAWRTRQSLPSFSQGVGCFVIVMLLQFFASTWFPKPQADAASVERGSLMLKQVLIQQLLMIAGPACLMAAVLTRDPKRTLRLTATTPAWVGGAALLAVLLHPAVVELQGRLKWFFGDLPPAARSLMESLSDPEIPVWLLFTAVAVAPALCEELAFRGFLLSGFGRRGRTIVAIVFSSLMFGAVHMIPQQVLNAALLGLLLGWMAVRSGSLLPGVVFHLVNNSLALWHGRFGTAWGETHSAAWFAETVEESLRYSGLTVAVGAAAAAGIVWRLSRPTDETKGSRVD